VIAHSIDHRESYTVNVAGAEVTDVRDLTERIGRLLGRAPMFEHWRLLR
jgi:hypothetical protein